MKKLNDFGGLMYSTNPDFELPNHKEAADETLPNEKQKLIIQLDKKNRGGKAVTLVTGFVGTDIDLQTLAKMLKNKCGVGGSAKEGEIIIQGEFRQKIAEILTKEGYKTAVR